MHPPPFEVPAVRDGVLLVARIGLGGILVAHGWQKLAEDGLGATAESFSGLDIPAPYLAACVAMLIELVGGAMLVAGLLTPLAGVLTAANMAGAFWFAHRGGGVFVGNGGWELVALIGLFGLTVAAAGPGRWSIDSVVAARTVTSRSTR